MAKRKWSPTPIRLVDDERFLDLSVEASDLLLRLYAWGCDGWGRFPAGKRALRRRTGVEYDPPLKILEKAGLIKLYEVGSQSFGLIMGYDSDAPANLINKRGDSEYPPPGDKVAPVVSVCPPQGKTKGSLTSPLDIDIDLDLDILKRGGNSGQPTIPTVDMVRDDCRDSAIEWFGELDAQRKTQRSGHGVRNRGVMAHCDTPETLATQFADHLARMADENPVAFRGGIKSMIRGGKGWIMNPLKYLQGAVRIASEKGSRPGRRSERKVGPQPDESAPVDQVPVDEYDEEALDFLGGGK
jgi:hypothetical protein